MRIGLLLDEGATRTRLTTWLGADHTVVAGGGPALPAAAGPLEVCLVAGALLPGARAALRAARAAAPPLIVVGLAGPEDAAALGPELGDTLDDVLAAEAPRAEVLARLALAGRLAGAERAAAATQAAAAGQATAVAQATAERAEARAFGDDVLKAVSHDLRTPLAIIHLQAQLLRELCEPATGADRGLARAVDAVLGAARRLNSMIDDLVDVSRFQRGLLKLEPRPLDVGVFLAELAPRAAPLLRSPPPRLEVAPATLVLAEEARLERILLNLMTHALRATPPGHRVALRAQALGGEVLLGVADDASAAAAEPLAAARARLGDEATLARQAAGLGGGLHVTAILVAAHGGRGWAERPGATGPPVFWLALPAA